MTEETPAAAKPNRRWGRAEWGPFALLACYTAAIIIWNPIGSPLPDGAIVWPIVFFGAMLCLPLQCALWTIWSPYPLKWRVPLGITASLFLGMALCAEDGNPTGFAMSFFLFLVFCFGFSLARVFGRWHLLLAGDFPLREDIAEGRQFSVRYLLAWTTVCALLLSLGRFVLFGSDPSSLSLLELAFLVLQTITVFGIAMLPIIGIGLIVLGRKRRVLLGILVLPFGVAFSALVMAWGMIEMNPGMPMTFPDIGEQMACFSSGAALSMLLTSVVLRYSGYRITRD